MEKGGDNNWTKLEAVRRVENGEILHNVATDLGIGISSLSDQVKNKSNIEEYCGKMESRKLMNNSEYEWVNEVLFAGFYR